MVDDLKAVFTHAGLGGEAGEYKLLTQSFLYKFLNDKFLYQAKVLDESSTYENLLAMSEEDYDWLLEDIGTSTAWLKPDQLIETLHRQQNEATFYESFEKTLNQIAIDNNDIFSVHTDGDTAIRLFDERLITDTISDSSKRNEVAKAIINLLARVKFDETIFSQGFDFFSTLFEYMIKDYNKDGGGKYAEYYTPHSVAKIIADILVGDDKPQNVRIYDPSAGSGTLLMNLASRIGVDKTTVYSQDISQKSSNLLRLNLILNGLQHSIHNIVQGNTIIANRHPEKMDYIVSNPPFKLDFSEWRDQVEILPEASDRFFAGVPKVPAKSKDKMAIYELFVQHIIYSLKPDGQAAVVLPTGFITAQSGIDKTIRQHLVDNQMLAGVVSMPSNIFATTGTNVSILFIDKKNKGDVVLIDASNLGTKVKEGKKALYTSPIPPKVDGAFQITRIALTSRPKSLASCSLRVWIAAEWPKPWNSTIWRDLAIPSSVFSDFNTAMIGESFSRVNGSFGPTSATSAARILVPSGTLKPACSAIQAAGLPTISAFNLPSAQFLLLAFTPKQ